SFDAELTEGLDERFQEYFRLAKSATRRMIETGMTPDVLEDLQEMQTRRNDLSKLIGQQEEAEGEPGEGEEQEGERQKELSEVSRDRLASELERLQTRQGLAYVYIIPGISVVAIVALIIFSYLVFYSVKKPVEQAVFVADQLSRGNMETTVHSERRDEIGQLLQSMQRMLVYLREMAGAAGSMA
ncbi:MAG: HAMP domain-containing protein, partial [bacterium]|nr:HAMP domain-containing protein [bacterium]